MSLQVFEHDSFAHEQVLFCHDAEVGLKAIIAIHNTRLGPALGGCRMYPYATEEEALRDVLRLSRGMTYKAATAGLDLGGGKAVIIGDPKTDKSEALFRRFGQHVESLGGRYITAEDVGTTVADMELIRRETRWVTGVAGYHGSGDPSPVTAWGVFHGIRAAVEERTGTPDLNGRRVAVQGAGHVGYHLCRYLRDSGAEVWAGDTDAVKVQRVGDEFGVQAVAPEAIYDLDVDVFAPCAMGAVLNDDTIPRLKATIVAGAANNQLADEARHSAMLTEHNILYAPDYVVNAGGLVNVYTELTGAPVEKGMNDAAAIYDSMRRIFAIARVEGVSSLQASDRAAEERVRTAGRLKGFTYGDGRA